MKTPFLLASHRGRPRSHYLVLTVIIILIFVMFGSILNHWLVPPSLVFGRPLFLAGTAVTNRFTNLANLLADRKQLVATNEALRERLSTLELALLERNKRLADYTEVDKLIGRTQGNSGRPARIISRPAKTPYDTVLVDLGQTINGPPVVVGDLALADDNVAVGAVTAVFGRTAKINLFSTPGASLTVSLAAAGIVAKATGVGGGNFKISLPRDIAIKEGDAVTIPAQLNRLLGVVGVVTKTTSDPFQEILFRSPLNFYQQSWLIILPTGHD